MPTDTAGALTVRSGSDRLVVGAFWIFLLVQFCLAAPGAPGNQRTELDDSPPILISLANPFGPGEEERRLLQSYLKTSVKDDQGAVELGSREQEVFFLFRLYDFDRSGALDGLEMMKLLSDYNSHNSPEALANEPVRKMVVSLVDVLLQTQDLNQDGLLAPSELLSPPLKHTEVPPQEQEEVREGETKEDGEANVETREEQKDEDQGQREEAKAEEEVQLKEALTPEGGGHTEGGGHPEEGLEKAKELDNPEPAAAEGEKEVSVHQGQPEM